MINTGWCFFSDLQLICSICVLFDFFWSFHSVFVAFHRRTFPIEWFQLSYGRRNAWPTFIYRVLKYTPSSLHYTRLCYARPLPPSHRAPSPNPHIFIYYMYNTLFISAWIISSMLKLFTYHSVGSHSGKSQLAISNDARTQQRQTLQPGNNRSTLLLACGGGGAALFSFLTPLFCALISEVAFLLFSMVLVVR